MKKRTNYFCYPGTVTVLVGTKEKNPKEVIEIIFAVIEMVTGVSKLEILAKDRHRKKKEARQYFHYLADKLTKETLQEIGRITNRTHATVIHSVKTVEGVMTYNKKMVETIDSMETEILRRLKLNESKTIIN